MHRPHPDPRIERELVRGDHLGACRAAARSSLAAEPPDLYAGEVNSELPAVHENDRAWLDDHYQAPVRRPRWWITHNVIAHPLLVIWPRVGEWLHDRTEPR